MRFDGSVASDGTGENGLYTEELLAQIRQEGMQIEDVFKKVRIGVMQRSNNMQTPWETSSLTGDFYFNGRNTHSTPLRQSNRHPI